MTPPVTKNATVTKNTRPVKKITRAAKQAELENAGEDATSMKSVLTAPTAVLTTLTQKPDDQGRPGPHPERTVSFTEDEPAPPGPSTSQASPSLVFDEMPSPDFPDMANAVREKLAHHLHSTLAPFLLTDNETGSDDEGAAPQCCRTTTKSGKLRTRDTHVVNWIKWPHEMVTASVGQALVYNDMNLVLFSNGYLTIVAGENSPVIKDTMLTHLRELFEEVYGLMVVREYYTAWLQLLEQGLVTWSDQSRDQNCGGS